MARIISHQNKNKIIHLIKYGWDTMIQDLKQEE